MTNLDITTQGTRTLMSDVPVVARLGDCGGEVWKVPANNVFLDLHPGVGRKKQVNSSTHHTHPQGWQFLCWGLLWGHIQTYLFWCTKQQRCSMNNWTLTPHRLQQLNHYSKHEPATLTRGLSCSEDLSKTYKVQNCFRNVLYLSSGFRTSGTYGESTDSSPSSA